MLKLLKNHALHITIILETEISLYFEMKVMDNDDEDAYNYL